MQTLHPRGHLTVVAPDGHRATDTVTPVAPTAPNDFDRGWPLDPKVFSAGMADLSGAFDWAGMKSDQADQIASRSASYWPVVRVFSTEDWIEALAYLKRTKKPIRRTDGYEQRPTFPFVAELYDACLDFQTQRRQREGVAGLLAAPTATPAPPEVAQAWIERIRTTIRGARGPLASALRGGGWVDDTQAARGDGATR